MVQPPAALRPYLNFSKQTPRSLEAVARVVDRDPAFRERVSGVIDEQQIGRPGWLWLTRPDGWEAELAALEASASAREAAVVEEREERAASRKLAASQAAAVRAEASAAARLVELDEARTDLARERTARTTAEGRVAELEQLLAEATDERAAVVRNLKDVEAKLVDRATEVNATKARIRALEAEARDRGTGTATGRAADAPSAPPTGAAVPPDPATGRPVTAVGDPTMSTGPDDTPARSTPGGAAPAGPDPATVAIEVARAAGGASALAEALTALARLLDGGAPLGRGAPAGHPVSRASAAPLVGAGEQPPSRGRRAPVALPGGVFDDSVEAADHLLRTPAAVLVVDGYNVTMEGWPDLSAADQRRRLLTCLSDLAYRTATAVELVFDGAEVEPLTMPTPARQMVRVRFSEPGVEADDVVIDLVGLIPATTPVIVASSDNRVRDGARRGGANLLHARQLLAVLRR